MRTTKTQVLGFTLIELVLVVVIVGILAAVAFPSYQHYVYKARRTDATTGLMDAAQRLERCYSRELSYSPCTIPSSSPSGLYNLALDSRTATTYTLSARPPTTSVQYNDTKCRTFTITHLGVRSALDADGSTDTTDDCWR